MANLQSANVLTGVVMVTVRTVTVVTHVAESRVGGRDTPQLKLATSGCEEARMPRPSKLAGQKQGLRGAALLYPKGRMPLLLRQHKINLCSWYATSNTYLIHEIR